MSVRSQLNLISLAVLLYAIINAWAVLSVVREMDDDSWVIGVSSQLRSLAQRVVTQELLGLSSEETRKTVEHHMNALTVGDVGLGIGLQGEATVQAVHDAQTRWASFVDSIQAFHKDPAQRAAMLSESEAYMALSDKVVTAALKESEGNVSTINARIVALSGFSALLALMIFLVSRGITASLTRTVATLASTSAEIASVLEQQTQFSAQQAASTNETTTAMEELRASSQLSSEQSQSAASHSRQVVQLTQEGSNSVEQTAQGIADLKGKVEGFSQQILRLSEQVSQIGSITTLVGDLASQTNMLALNAAVEAVRAGEQGRGFAVVAAEIRKLADQSRRSAERIGSLVGDIQQATNTTVMIAEQGIRTAEDSSQRAQQAARKLGGVATSMTSIYDSVEQISLTARQQAEAVRQVLEAMTAVNAGARQTAGGISQTREGVFQLNQAAGTLKGLVGIQSNGASPGAKA